MPLKTNRFTRTRNAEASRRSSAQPGASAGSTGSKTSGSKCNLNGVAIGPAPSAAVGRGVSTISSGINGGGSTPAGSGLAGNGSTIGSGSLFGDCCARATGTSEQRSTAARNVWVGNFTRGMCAAVPRKSSAERAKPELGTNVTTFTLRG